MLHRLQHYKQFACTFITVVICMLWGLGAKDGNINAQKLIEDTSKNLTTCQPWSSCRSHMFLIMQAQYDPVLYVK